MKLGMKKVTLAGMATATLLAGSTGLATADDTRPGDAATDASVVVEYFADENSEGRSDRAPVGSPHVQEGPVDTTAAGPGGEVVALSETGTTEDRMDVTIIGDGYTAAQQGEFLEDARTKWAAISAIEPFKSYTGLMNVWAVKAESQDSGVTGDPSADVKKNTALGSYFWCNGIERLLCVDLNKAKAYAAKAPASDLVFVVSNSTKYGGAGYNSLEAYGYPFDGLSTMSSDNAASALIGAHEIAHSVGRLADEYTYPSYGTWPAANGEANRVNASIYTAEQMAERKTKWWQWLGEKDPAGGVVGTVEGNFLYPAGIYRPTTNSIMRALNTDKFNLPSREGMVAGFYRYADAVSPLVSTEKPVSRDTVLSVRVADLPGDLAALSPVRWYVDGREVVQNRGKDSILPIAAGVPGDGKAHDVTATVVDNTEAVRADYAKKAVESSVTWTVTR